MATTENAESTALPGDSPARYACYAAIVIGLGLAIGGIYATVEGDWPKPLAIAIMVIGSVQIGLSLSTLRRSRLAWGFLTSIHATGVVLLFFAGPTIRDAFDVGLGLALIPSFVYGLLCTLLAIDAIHFKR